MMRSAKYENIKSRDIIILRDNVFKELNKQLNLMSELAVINTKKIVSLQEEDTKEYERLIPDCGLILYDGCTHYAYLERLNQTINIINNFIR